MGRAGELFNHYLCTEAGIRQTQRAAIIITGIFVCISSLLGAITGNTSFLVMLKHCWNRAPAPCPLRSDSALIHATPPTHNPLPGPVAFGLIMITFEARRLKGFNKFTASFQRHLGFMYLRFGRASFYLFIGTRSSPPSPLSRINKRSLHSSPVARLCT